MVDGLWSSVAEGVKSVIDMSEFGNGGKKDGAPCSCCGVVADFLLG